LRTCRNVGAKLGENTQHRGELSGLGPMGALGTRVAQLCLHKPVFFKILPRIQVRDQSPKLLDFLPKLKFLLCDVTQGGRGLVTRPAERIRIGNVILKFNVWSRMLIASIVWPGQSLPWVESVRVFCKK